MGKVKEMEGSELFIFFELDEQTEMTETYKKVKFGSREFSSGVKSHSHFESVSQMSQTSNSRR